MTIKKHLEIFNKGAEAWNNWRRGNPNIKPVLLGSTITNRVFSNFDLKNTNLQLCSFYHCKFIKTNFKSADLTNSKFFNSEFEDSFFDDTKVNVVQFQNCKFTSTGLQKSDFSDSFFEDCDFKDISISESNLDGIQIDDSKIDQSQIINSSFKKAKINVTRIRTTLFFETSFYASNLAYNSFISTEFEKSNFLEAEFGGSVFSAVEFKGNFNMEKAFHYYPSYIDFMTLNLSRDLPNEFMIGCGLNDWEIEFSRLYGKKLDNHSINDILYKLYDQRAHKAIQISPIFISYSHKDAVFVQALEKKLTSLGIRCWRDVHSTTAGRLESQIDKAIRHNPTVLLILSKDSVNSDWVQHEAREARKLEKELNKDILCPIALDESWKKSNWPKRLHEQILEYNILDFSHWKDETKFSRKFSRLIDGLDLYYK